MLDAIVRTVADDGRTVIFSSHLLVDVERLSEHVTMIHEGRFALDGALDNVRREYERTSVAFGTPFDRLPALDGVLTAEGGGRSWSVVHAGPMERFRVSLAAHGGEIVQSREATLEEIFVARVGRGRSSVEAA
jgi:ABC-2 type transport system ATP-binding protein